MNHLIKYADMIPEEMYEAMSNESEVNVRKFVATHTKSPKTLMKLGKDTAPEVLTAVATNLHTPKETLIELSKLTRKSILIALFKNPHTPKVALLNIIATLLESDLLTP